MASAYFVRSIHVGAAAVLIGGALLVIILSLRWASRPEHHEPLLDAMQVYEFAFWAAVGLLVMTGVGNLAHFGEVLPEPETAWGGKLSVKLFLVVVLAVFSLIRSLAVGLLLQPQTPVTEQLLSTLTGMYIGSIILVVSIAAFAVALAHFPSL